MNIDKATLDATVDRFLAWPLPDSVYPDAGKFDAVNNRWRSGTNLLSATEARAMLEHVLAALTGAQPAPAAPSDGKWVPLEPTEAMSVEGFSSDAWGALRTAVSRKKGWPYSCNEAADCVEGIYRAMISAAPAAQPADSAMEVLSELVAALDAHDFGGMGVSDRLSDAWDRARALTAASKERSKTHE
jgi:S-formylglutathione hydrolase FrmB